MPHSEPSASSSPVPTPNSEEFEQMEQDSPVKTEVQDDTTADITIADVNAMTISEEPKKDVKLEELFADVDSDEEFPSTGPDSSAGQR